MTTPISFNRLLFKPDVFKWKMSDVNSFSDFAIIFETSARSCPILVKGAGDAAPYQIIISHDVLL